MEDIILVSDDELKRLADILSYVMDRTNLVQSW